MCSWKEWISGNICICKRASESYYMNRHGLHTSVVGISWHTHTYISYAASNKILRPQLDFFSHTGLKRQAKRGKKGKYTYAVTYCFITLRGRKENKIKWNRTVLLYDAHTIKPCDFILFCMGKIKERKKEKNKEEKNGMSITTYAYYCRGAEKEKE